MKTKRQTVPVYWNAEVGFVCPTRCKTKHPTMKALILYDDATCAASTNAILHRAADRADISVKWDIRPWRLNMLRFTPTAEEAMSDAADAHLIVFAIRNIRSLPTWLMSWLERWALLRQSPGVALAIVGCGTVEASLVMRQFARRFGLSFIWEGQEPQLGVGFITKAASAEYKSLCCQSGLPLEIGRTTRSSLLPNHRETHIGMNNQNHCVRASETPGGSTSPTRITIQKEIKLYET